MVSELEIAEYVEAVGDRHEDDVALLRKVDAFKARSTAASQPPPAAVEPHHHGFRHRCAPGRREHIQREAVFALRVVGVSSGSDGTVWL